MRGVGIAFVSIGFACAASCTDDCDVEPGRYQFFGVSGESTVVVDCAPDAGSCADAGFKPPCASGEIEGVVAATASGARLTFSGTDGGWSCAKTWASHNKTSCIANYACSPCDGGNCDGLTIVLSDDEVTASDGWRTLESSEPTVRCQTRYTTSTVRSTR